MVSLSSAGLPGLYLASAADEADWALGVADSALGLEVLQPIVFGGSWVTGVRWKREADTEGTPSTSPKVNQVRRKARAQGAGGVGG